MKKTFPFFLSLLFLLVSGCGSISPENGKNERKDIPLTTKQGEYIKAGNEFAWRFMAKVDEAESKGEKGDWFVSPLSLQIALGMLLNGAQGETAAEICRTLGYKDGETAYINDWCKLMLDQLPQLDKKTDLTLADAIFVKKGVPLKDPYVKTVEQYYDAAIENLDFYQVEKSTKYINNWCSKQTKGLIPKVIDKVSPDLMAYLINALYFKSEWQEKFPKANTSDERFTYEDGTTGQVPMMKLDGKSFRYGETETYQFIRLPYGNGAFCMTVVLPKEGTTVHEVTALLEKEKPSFLDTRSLEVDLWLPRFETKYHIQLNDILAELGMPLSFIKDVADFKAMSEYASHVDFVTQDAVVRVDEEGTEAAAVTVIGMVEATGIPFKTVFHADHPFLYLITEQSTGAILFAGKYAGR